MSAKVILRRVRVMTSVYYALMVEYRAEIVFWAIATSLPLIMMGIWIKAGASGEFQLNEVQMARYFIAVFVVRQVTVVWVIHDFEYHVVTGRLSPLLLQPVDPSWRFVFSHVAEQFSRLPIAALLVGMCFLLYPAALWGTDEHPGFWAPHWSRILLAILACYWAFVLRYLIQYTFAMGAFWFERIASAHQVIFLPYLFLSGMVFPLQELSGTIRALIMLTPFPYMVWFPASLMTDAQPPLILRSFVVILVWSVAFWILNRWLWRRGLKHYSAMGA